MKVVWSKSIACLPSACSKKMAAHLSWTVKTVYVLDDWELREDIQKHCRELWPNVTNENLFDVADYQQYKDEFLKLFGFRHRSR